MSLIYSLEQLFDIRNSPFVKKPDRLPDGIGFESNNVDYNKMKGESDIFNKERPGNIEIFKSQKSFYTSDSDKMLLTLDCDSSMSFVSAPLKARNIGNNDDNSKKVTEFCNSWKIIGRTTNSLESNDSLGCRANNDEKRINLIRVAHDNSKIIDKPIFRDDKGIIEEKKSYKHKTRTDFRNKKCRNYSVPIVHEDVALKKILYRNEIQGVGILNLENVVKNDFSDDFKHLKTDIKNITNIPNIFDNNLKNYSNLEHAIFSDEMINKDKISALRVSQKTLSIEHEKKRILDSNESFYDNSPNFPQSKIVDGGFDSVHSLSNLTHPLKYSDVNSNKTSRFFNFFTADSIKSESNVRKLNSTSLLNTCFSDETTNDNFLSTRFSTTGLVNELDYTHEDSRISFSNSRTNDDIVGFQRIMAMLKKSNQSISNDHLVSCEMISEDMTYKNNEHRIQVTDDMTKYESVMNKDSSDSNFFMSLLNQSSRLSSFHNASENEILQICNISNEMSRYNSK
ncbi:uncharacterized protein T551_00595 [Pneumocystis jirovecii RU7]|uniref:Uncharacterized protein n=1 Tax=Pneumocystis jirovecii (strain RU7) TaxID=1408657 RepID=A0A0W4ZVW5_PNEJ7|nr:uncharacterized protein T551_00595 [Pneumocystis jirovecii RU7]KTW32505.1 hypothetical protein T551_00595 [Pneumocystis jirovecii RU7]